MAVWYFAYGSNMQTATFCGRRQIEFAEARPGRLSGWRLVLDKPPLVPVGESFANIRRVADPEAIVLGVLYRISEDDLAHIDLTEGVLIGNYQRVPVTVELHGTVETVDAFTLTCEQSDPTLKPSTRYMALLIAGAIEHGLPTDYVDWLRAVPACEETSDAASFRPLMDDLFAKRRD
jgi:hypothetical protein